MSISETIGNGVNAVVAPVSGFLDSIVFYSVMVNGTKLPLIVVWLVCAALFFTFYLGAINLRGIGHAIDLIKRKPKFGVSGEISAVQALTTALSGTVGLGNIAGAAVAISIGGPGAALWMVLAGFFGMSTKFVECTLAVKYRDVHEDGTVSGGPMYYLSKGLKNKGMPRTGRILAVMVAVAFPFASLNMFQVNQSHAQFAHATGLDQPLLYGIVLSAFVGAAIIGGIKSIGAVAEKIVPSMCALYLVGGIAVLAVNAPEVPRAIGLIFTEAFNPTSVAGGIVGALVAGIKRAVYSNEAGLGTSAVAHAAVKTDQPLTEGFVSLLEPLIDSCIVCFMTAIIVVVTGAYLTDSEGVVMTSNAFATVLPWFPIILTVSVILFAYTSIISWFYYGLKGFTYLVGERKNIILGYKIFYCIQLAAAAVIPLDKMIELADSLNFVLAIPNIIGLYFLAGEVKKDLREYWPKREEYLAETSETSKDAIS